MSVSIIRSAQLGQTLLSGALVNLIVGSGPGEIEKGSELPSVFVPDMMTAVQEELLPTIAGIMPKVDSLLVSLNNLVLTESQATFTPRATA